MQTTVLDNAREVEVPAATIHAVIAYQDFATGARAKHALDHIAHETGHEGEFAQTMWKFDVLRMPKLRDMAAEEAAIADLIVISAHGDDSLPAAVREWIEDAAARRGQRAGGIVLLLDRLDGIFEGPRGIRAYLRKIAREADLDYFEHGDVRMSVSSEPSSSAERREPAAGAIPVQSTLFREKDIRQWGINE
jgi:hypothetical protein